MRKILIVDDDSLVRHVLARHLSNEHTEVRTSETGYDALSNVHTSFYNLCLLDIKLPDINGLEVMKKIKVMSPGTKVVIMTADFITDEMKKEINNTAHGFLSKPFDLSQIKAISDELVHGNENMKERRQVKRTPSLDIINYYVVIFEDKEMKVLELKGDIIDISNRGIGMRTDYLLTPGYMIRFSDETKFRAGVVKWSMSVGNNSHCAGIEFIDYKEAPWFR